MADTGCVGGCSWTRTLRSVLSAPQEYNAWVDGPAGVTGTVTPSNFTIPAGGTQAITIELNVSGATPGVWTFADVHIEPVIPLTAPTGGGSASFTSSPNVSIPDNGYDGTLGSMACDIIDASSIPAGATITDVTIEQTATHTWVGDMTVKLETPDGTVLALMERPQGDAATNNTGDNGADSPFGDSSNFSSSFPISYNDTYTENPEQMGLGIGTSLNVCGDDSRCQFFPNPDQALVVGNSVANFAALDGENASGNWRLCMGDGAGGDLGTFVSWTLTVDYTGGSGGSGTDVPVHMPVAVIPSVSNLPSLVTIEADSNTGTYTVEDLQAIEITDLTSVVSGLVLGTQTTEALNQDPTNGNPYNGDGGTFYVTMTVPADAPRLVAEIIYSEAPDADLFVGTGSTPSAGTQVCASTTPASEEYCNINNPTAGTWWVLVQSWQGSANQPDDITLSAAVVPDSDAGNMTITGPSSVPAGDPFDLDINWDEATMVANDRWYGSFALGTDAGNPDNLGTVGVNLIRLPDIVLPPTIDVSPASLETALGPDTAQTLPLTISNLGDEDLDWTIDEDEIPDVLYSTITIPSAPAGTVTIGDGPFGFSSSGATGGIALHALNAPAGLTTITHSASQSIVTGNSVACSSGGLHTDNSYVRRFNLADFGITDQFDVVEVSVGVEVANGASGSQPITVNLYTWNPSDPFTFANFTLVGSSNVNIPNQSLTIYTIPVAGSLPPGSTLVVELFTPSGQAAGNSFFVGSNAAGQTAPSFIAAAACGIANPTDLAAIGFPNMHIVMNVTGDIVPPTGGVCANPEDIPWASVDPTSGTTLGGESSTVDVTFDSTGLALGVYTGTLCINSNDSVTPLVTVPLMLTVEPAAYGVDVAAEADALSGAPGTTVTYTVWVTNTGNVVDAFDLSVSGNTWDTTPSDASVVLGVGASTSVAGNSGYSGGC